MQRAPKRATAPVVPQNNLSDLEKRTFHGAEFRVLLNFGTNCFLIAAVQMLYNFVPFCNWLNNQQTNDPRFIDRVPLLGQLNRCFTGYRSGVNTLRCQLRPPLNDNRHHDATEAIQQILSDPNIHQEVIRNAIHFSRSSKRCPCGWNRVDLDPVIIAVNYSVN